ncbi:hypothetical protein A3F19_02465 [Candidatus Nomurabacteria bacterium RIFCSPHIGHO2_12_FULL_37_29]|uniref:Uncharacterized protein n=2 Tax=Candidatus Nomuraibacteriota TaxID=1752729 RepID=A0A1F6Y6F3_9BACT|nr:MAG: hypothetical protein A2727_02005 [Candidatus Nomurabacteria bacterium RIFCSPHIGHO2_01_FULL_37_110]OGI79336.1 MAG: hypothetical protein A3F19_02465 [Candidatus Nomurabacteria bacterium RIFCSPHIGHO2_12_FULL_37_29]OGI84885.1 MAG: hypothetical protein A3A92_00975 [Candidatus Nomurabacteria bacterium RIFCSPLOWO2_01_FULL_37_49]OGJ01905.1 MAG: hypothetical protein A3G98_01255 [Candidatus Nomurabacteria bacterium RIFCSPLOWO2_12_FULL_37_8]
MINAILSILIFTGVVWGLNKKLPIQICSICAGVTLTWLWMLGGMWLGVLSVSRYEFLAAILMGASIGGIVTEIKKMFLKLRARSAGKSKEVETLEDKLKNCC